jgi:hypothetical protein
MQFGMRAMDGPPGAERLLDEVKPRFYLIRAIKSHGGPFDRSL